MWRLHLYLTISERKFYRKGHCKGPRKVSNIFSEERRRKQTITFFAYSNLQLFSLKKDKLDLEKATSLSVLE